MILWENKNWAITIKKSVLWENEMYVSIYDKKSKYYILRLDYVPKYIIKKATHYYRIRKLFL
jgi:hypothetical protein